MASETRPRAFTIVLTGGIASGKSVVSEMFRDLGATVVDTDEIARELVKPGQPALGEIRDTFGPEFLDESGHLRRGKMREKIFTDAKARKQLENILHPLIASKARSRVDGSTGPYCILVIPLYSESARWSWIDRVLVVDCDENQQVRRVVARDGVDEIQARAILEAQASRKQRLALADDVIENNGEVSRLHPQVAALDQEYRRLAASAKAGWPHEPR